MHGSRGSPDLGGEVGKRGEVVAEHRGGVRETVAGQLHPVAGVAGEADDDALFLFDLLRHLARASGPAASFRGSQEFAFRLPAYRVPARETAGIDAVGHRVPIAPRSEKGESLG